MRQWKERRREKGEGGGGSGQRGEWGVENAKGETKGGNYVVRREMGNVKQEGGGK